MKRVLRILLAILILLNMTMILTLSSQTGEESLKTSTRLTEKVFLILSALHKPEATSPSTTPVTEPSTKPSTAPSTEPSTEPSTKPSGKPTNPSKPQFTEAEKKQIQKMDAKMRKVAHAVEFGCLGLLSLLFCSTWEDKYLLIKYLLVLAFVLTFAGIDELLQTVTTARGGMIKDVLIDLSGALISCTLALPLLLLSQHKRRSTQKKGIR